MAPLRTRYAAAIEAATNKAKASRDVVTVPAFDGAEAYAYLKPETGSVGASTQHRQA
jgi:hypothetical protein